MKTRWKDKIGFKVWFAWRLRFLADKLDSRGAPKRTDICYQIVEGIGIVTNLENEGCPLWYYGEDDHDKAFKDE